MEVIVVFVLLCLFVNNGQGTPQMNNVFRNQTWYQASNDSKCSMIGLNLTGEIEENIDNISSSIAWDKHQTAWIGAYAKRVWVNFEGCYYGRFESNDSWLSMTSQGDLAKTCLQHCNYRRFVLTEDKCVCYKDVKDVIKTGCLAGKCSDTNYPYCGKGSAAITKNITYYCMCRFSMENDSSDLYGEGNCLTVTYKPTQHVMAMNCSHTYRPICYVTNTKQIDLSGSSNNWLQSLSECYNNNKQFASRTTNVTGNYDGTYWVGTFAVTYKLWGLPRTTNNSCVAVNIDITNNHLTTVVLPCDTLLQALCLNTSISHEHTEVTTECFSSCKHPSATNPHQLSSIQNISTTTVNILAEGQNKDPVPLIVGYVVGCVVLVIFVTAVILFLRRRMALRKSSTGTCLSHSQVEERNQSSVIHSDGMETNADTLTEYDGVNVYENIKIRNTNGTDTTERVDGAESHRYSERDTTNIVIYSNDAAIYQQELFEEENPGSYYCGLSEPSRDEHEYGQLT